MKGIVTVCLAAHLFLQLIIPGLVAADYTTQTITKLDSSRKFSMGVDIDGDYAIIGDSEAGSGDVEYGGIVNVYEIEYGGLAYIYKRNSEGIWELHQELYVDEISDNYYFGSNQSVAISGGYAIVGAPFDDEDGVGAGAAFIFEQGEDDNWLLKQKLTVSSGVIQNHFGISVEISGTKAIIGASPTTDNLGSAYVFERNGSELVPWNETASFFASDGVFDDNFGNVVAIDGGVAIVGAEGDSTSKGAAYIFEWDEINGWPSVESVKIMASDGSDGDCFGRSVAIEYGTAVVGAYCHNSRTGALYVYDRDNENGWPAIESTKLIASDGVPSDQFGYSVDIEGNFIAVGARATDSYIGSIYVFEESDLGWVQIDKVTLGTTMFLGWDISFSDNQIIIAGTASEEAIVISYLALPVAVAGGPYDETATSWEGAIVQLDGTSSFDPAGDVSLLYFWDVDLSLDSDGDGDSTNDLDFEGLSPDVDFPVGVTDIALYLATEDGRLSEPDVTTVTVSFIKTNVDIKPRFAKNWRHKQFRGILPIVFLTTEAFDASTIDPLTIAFWGEDFDDGLVKTYRRRNKPMAWLRDINRDGDLDLLVLVEANKLRDYEIEELLRFGAMTYDGYVVVGEDIIELPPIKRERSKWQRTKWHRR